MATTTMRLTKAVLAVFAFVVSAVLADGFGIDWYTVDGGGPGAPGWSTGGGFELVGGFWAAPPCWCMSDVNNDGLRDGLDVQGFVDCMIAGGVNCACADLYTDGLLDVNDIDTFVGDLLAGGDCS
jgi:hypothetical protein